MIMNKTTLTLIIPVYNTEKYIKRCLDSVICQRSQDLEVIVVNDNSTDDSLSIITDYAKKYSCIKIINLSTNQGAGYARNIGLKNAKGKYIGFIDSDDWVDIDMYNIMLNYLQKNNADIAVCGVKNEYQDCRIGSYRYHYNNMKILSNECALRILAKSLDVGVNISSIVCNKLFRADLFSNSNLYFPPNSYNEDDYFTFMSFIHSKKIILTPSCYYHYYQRANSITHSFSKKHINDLFSTFSQLKYNLEKSLIYELYKREFWSFFEKCLIFTMSAMFNSEQNNIVQKRYIEYTIETYLKYFSITELVDNISMAEFKRYLGLL